MKKYLSLLLTVLLCLSAAACAGKSEPPASSPGPSEGAPAAEIGPDGRLPVEYEFSLDSRRFSDPLPESEFPQLICKEDTAARLALAVEKLSRIGITNLPDFDSDHPLDPAIAAQIAIENTRRIDLGGYGYNNYLTGVSGFEAYTYPDHPVLKLMGRLFDEGRFPCGAFYAEDVLATMESLFGITGWTPEPVGMADYFPEEGVFIIYYDRMGKLDDPQVLSWEETETGYTCEVILIHTRLADAGGDELVGTVNGVVVTEDNVQEIAAREAHYAFTFDMTSGEPVATAFAQTQESLAQRAERLVDDYLWSSSPKAQAVGMIETAALCEKIPQYHYENGTLEPIQSSSHYPVAANGKVFGIFMDMRDPELGGSWSFSSEYADQLNAFSEQNDQICIIYDQMVMYLVSPTGSRPVYIADEQKAALTADPLEDIRPDLKDLDYWNASQPVSIGSLYFDPETWAENRASVPQS